VSRRRDACRTARAAGASEPQRIKRAVRDLLVSMEAHGKQLPQGLQATLALLPAARAMALARQGMALAQHGMALARQAAAGRTTGNALLPSGRTCYRPSLRSASLGGAWAGGRVCTPTHAGVVWDRWATDPGGRSTSGASVERANRDSPWPGPAVAVALAVSPAVATAGTDHAGGDTMPLWAGEHEACRVPLGVGRGALK
jgi:hypothetical protein